MQRTDFEQSLSYCPPSPFQELNEAKKFIENAKNDSQNEDPPSNEIQELTQSIAKFTLMNVEKLSEDCHNGKVVESILESEKRTKVKLQGLSESFWVFGKLPEKHTLKKGDVVDIQFETIKVNSIKQNWITLISISENKKVIKESFGPRPIRKINSVLS